MGRTSLASGDAGTAAGLLSQALAVDPNNLDAALGLGEAALRLDRLQEAVEAFERALKIDPGNEKARMGYARSMIGLDRPEAALQQLESLSRENPGDPRVANLLGVALDLSGRHAEAQKVYLDALRVDPNLVTLQNNLALSLALADRFEEARRALEPLAEGPQSTRRLRQNLALIYGLEGNVVAAERLSRLDLDDDAVRNNLAYFAAMRAMTPDQRRAQALAPRPMTDGPAPVEIGANLVLGVALDGEDLALGRSPTGSWFVNLGHFTSEAAAKTRWQMVRRQHADLVSGLTRLAGAGSGSQPLMIGPLPSAEAADDLCRSLEAQKQSCRPLRL